MRLISLFSVLVLILLSSCDPKVDQRAPRFDPAVCPSCKGGVCAHCKGKKECQQCNGTGTRVTSTKNYTGEGVKLVDLPETCPFCKGSGLCEYCEGTGDCYKCEGTTQSEEWESAKEKYNNKKDK